MTGTFDALVVGAGPTGLACGIELQQRVHAVIREGEAELPLADLPAEALNDQQLQVRLVIDDKDA